MRINKYVRNMEQKRTGKNKQQKKERKARKKTGKKLAIKAVMIRKACSLMLMKMEISLSKPVDQRLSAINVRIAVYLLIPIKENFMQIEKAILPRCFGE